MKALILTMTCGECHNMIAKSLSEQFNNKNIENKIVQLFGYNDKVVKRENNMFLFACKYFPHIYDYIWNKLRTKNNSKNSGHVLKAAKYIHNVVKQENPDLIICTHLYASNLVCELKNRNLIDKNIKITTIMHDYCTGPLWELSRGVDYIFQIWDKTTDNLIKKGYSQSQIKTFGLPIRSNFSEIVDLNNKNKYFTRDLRKKLSLPDNFLFLIISGGNGFGGNLKLIKNLLKANIDASIVVINGKNEKSNKKLAKFINKNNIKNIVNLGFVDNISEYILSADCIISRCGSGTISEVLALGKPLIIREKMIINEKITRDLLVENNCALALKNVKDITAKAQLIANDKKLYNLMRSQALKFSKPKAAEQIVDFLIKDINQ